VRDSEHIVGVASIRVLPMYELAIGAVCDYFGVQRRELFARSRDLRQSSMKHMAFWVLKNECQLTDSDIAQICGTTKQNVSYAIGKVDAIRKIYTGVAYDLKNIIAKVEDLKNKQEEWLREHLPESNMSL